MLIADKAFNRLVLVGVTLGFGTLMLVVGLSFWMLSQYREQVQWVGHTYAVSRSLANFDALSEQAETARRGYLLRRESRFHDAYRAAAAEQPAVLARLESLTADNAERQQQVRDLSELSRRQLAVLDESIGLVRAGAAEEAATRFRTDGSPELMFQIRELSAEMQQAEAALLEDRLAEQVRGGQGLIAMLAAAGAVLLLVAGGSLWVIMRYTRDLGRSRDALKRVNEGLEDAVSERTADLQRANDEIQRFAYIVSHDLRSPLVNIMGFTSELSAIQKPLDEMLQAAEAQAPDVVSAEARAAVREELPEAIGFIRTSTQKMDRLINAILRLSREGRRVMNPEPLKMGAILGGVADSMAHKAGELGAEVVIEPPLPDIVGDRVVVEQVFSNLVDNALKYRSPTRPGRIAVRGWREPGRVVYEVQDNGRGIDPKDHERIFELFRRSGAQDQPGEGIGLAHVRALVYRLGGVISCASNLDRGATFRISLPLASTSEQGA